MGLNLLQVPVEEQEYGDAGQSFGRKIGSVMSEPAGPSQPVHQADTLADRDSEQAHITALAQNYVKCLQLLLQVR